MEVMARKEARACGLERYFTGEPCKNGHVAPRNAITGKCTECRFPSANKWREYNSRWKAKYPGREQEVKYRHRYGVEISKLPPKPTVCSVCGDPHKKIVLDHCHDSGKFRAWLCDPCNVTIGAMKENPDRLRKLADYLEAHNGTGS